MVGFIISLAVLGLLALILRAKRQNKDPLHSDSVVLVAGACMGIGQELVKLLAQHRKCKLIVLDRRADLFPQVRGALTALGAKEVTLIQLDLSNSQQVQALLDSGLKDLTPDLFVYNAGIVNSKFAHRSEYSEDLRVQTVNFLTPMLMAQHFAKKMARRGRGHMMFTGSIASVYQSVKMSSYCASKAAIYQYVNCLRSQMRLVCPAMTITFVMPYHINTTLFPDFESLMSLLVPTLRMEDVGRRLYEAIERRQEEVFIPWVFGPFRLLIVMLPVALRDKLANFLNKNWYSQAQILPQ